MFLFFFKGNFFIFVMWVKNMKYDFTKKKKKNIKYAIENGTRSFPSLLVFFANKKQLHYCFLKKEKKKSILHFCETWSVVGSKKFVYLDSKETANRYLNELTQICYTIFNSLSLKLLNTKHKKNMIRIYIIFCIIFN